MGVASKQFTSDTVKWSIFLQETAAPDNLKVGYEKLNQQLEGITQELEKLGINVDSINKKPINVYEEYDFKNSMNGKGEERVFTGFRLQQNLFIISKKVDELENLAFNPMILFEKGIVINSSNLEYYSSRIDDLKKEIIAEATANARERGIKMLENTDVKLGKMLSLNSGVFQITEPYSTSVSSSGIYDTSTRDKQIRVTVHAVFSIK